MDSAVSAESFGYRLADVFAERRYEGNGVAVFVDPPRLSQSQLMRVTTEVRQFESAYLWPTPDPTTFETRIFVVDRELEFAGHPVLGAAAVLHERHGAAVHEQQWTLRLGTRAVSVRTLPDERGGYDVSMEQGTPAFGPVMDDHYRSRVAQALSLEADDLVPELPVQWVSTGLRYLIVPVRPDALTRARIGTAIFGELLAEAGALLCYVLDPENREGRNWVNDGSVEDIATGSASGPAASYLARYRLADMNKTIELAQGRFLNRPSIMRVDLAGEADRIDGVRLSGHVCLTGTGTMDGPPALR
uniref:PhzF family phenazine biosynthesis protein n=1 Tax=Nonomuraea sp. CA-252377 TaxID=3240003 RepID=UPI003F492817